MSIASQYPHPLDLKDPHLHALVNHLKNHADLNASLDGGVQVFKPAVQISIEIRAGAEPLACWWNVKEAENAGDGTAVFGWSFWRDAKGHAVAQHHAVLELASGEWIDITPTEQDAPAPQMTTFLHDIRVAFDYQSQNSIASLFYREEANWEGLNFVWVRQDWTRAAGPYAR